MNIVARPLSHPKFLNQQRLSRLSSSIRTQSPSETFTAQGRELGTVQLDLSRFKAARLAFGQAAEKTEDTRTLLFRPDSKSWRELQKAEDELEQLKAGTHQGLVKDNIKTREVQAKAERSLRLGFRERMKQIREKRDGLRGKRELLKRELTRFFPTQRDRIASHRNASTTELAKFMHKTEKGREAYPHLERIWQNDERLSKENLSPQQRENLRLENSQKKEALKQLGFDFPSEQRLKRFEESGLPQDDSPQSVLERTVFHKTRARQLDRALPRTPKQREDYRSSEESKLALEAEKIDKEEDRVKRTFARESSKYRIEAQQKREDLKAGLEAGLRRRTSKEARTFPLSELSDSVRNSPAMANVPKDAEAVLKDGRLSFQSKDGFEVLVETSEQGVRISSDRRHRHAWGEILSGQVHHSVISPDGKTTHKTELYTKSGGKLKLSKTTERTVDAQGSGTESVFEGEKLVSVARLKSGVLVKQNGPGGYEYSRTDNEDGSVTTNWSKPDGSYGHETVGKDGRVSEYDELLKTASSTVRTRLLNPKTGEAEITSRETSHNGAHGYDAVTTTVKRAKFDDKGQLGQEKVVAKTRDRVEYDRPVSKHDLASLPGNWAQDGLFNTPRELVEKVRAQGDFRVFNTTREITDQNGDKRVEHLRTFTGKDIELTESYGKNQASVFTLRKKNKDGKWNSETFFQGSPNNVIRNYHSEEGDFEVETTITEMPDHPGAAKSEVPQKSTAKVKRTSEGTEAQVTELVKEMGFDSTELQSSKAYQQFQNLLKNNEGKLEIEFQQSNDVYEDSDKNTRVAVLVVKAPNGSRLILSNDAMKGQGGVQSELRNKAGRLIDKTATIFLDGERYEEKSDTQMEAPMAAEVENFATVGREATEAVGDLRDGWGAARKFFRPSKARFGLRALRRARESSKNVAVDVIGQRINVVAAGLSATSAIYELSQGNYKGAARSGAQTLEDLGELAAAAQKAKGLRPGLGGGKFLLLKGLGVAGALAGGLSAWERFQNKDPVGGTVDIISSVGTAGAMLGVPVVGWVAAGASVLNMARDLYQDVEKRVDLAPSYL